MLNNPTHLCQLHEVFPPPTLSLSVRVRASLCVCVLVWVGERYPGQQEILSVISLQRSPAFIAAFLPCRRKSRSPARGYLQTASPASISPVNTLPCKVAMTPWLISLPLLDPGRDSKLIIKIINWQLFPHQHMSHVVPALSLSRPSQ